MKFYIFIFFLFSFIESTFSQVNLDAPIFTTSEGKVYLATSSRNVAYYIPTFIEIDFSPDVRVIGNRANIYFYAGTSAKKMSELEEEIKSKYGSDMELRVIRAFNVSLDDRGSFDIAPRYRPETQVLGDLGDIVGPIPFVISLSNAELDIKKRIDDALFLNKSAVHLGTIYYEFNALSDGKPYQAKTTLNIFTREHREILNPPRVNQGPDFPVHDHDLLISKDIKSPQIRDILLKKHATTISKDVLTQCWSKIAPGQFCIR